MNTNKRGRPTLPDGMKSVTTSIRLRPDRLAKYKELGGVEWLNMMLDEELEMDDMIESFNMISFDYLTAMK